MRINDKRKHRYKELDALRGIAALLVVFFHFTVGRPESELGFKLGTTGVDLFFIISGFVIFMSLTKVHNSLDFVVNRVSRLYPTYWACVTFTFLLSLAVPIYYGNGFEKSNFFQYLGNMTMFQHYLKIRDLDGPYWTMIIEMVFYMAILLLFHLKLLKHLNYIGLILSIAVVFVSIYFYESYKIVRTVLNIIPLLQFVPLFFAGTIFYKIYVGKNKFIEHYSLLLVCLVCQILLYNHAGRYKSFINHGEYAAMLMAYFLIFTLLINDKLAFIVTRETLFFGKISFSLYLIHQFVSTNFIIPFLINRFHINFWIASFCIALPIAVALATIVTYYIEAPMGKWMKKILRFKSVPVKTPVIIQSV